MNIAAGPLMHEDGAVKALLRQIPEALTGFIFFCEVTNQNAVAHYNVLFTSAHLMLFET